MGSAHSEIEQMRWKKENPDKNPYVDYSQELFRKGYERHPEFQTPDGNFIEWQIPGSRHRLVLFFSGMGDGIYSGYWGLDAEGESVCLVTPFMNLELF